MTEVAVRTEPTAEVATQQPTLAPTGTIATLAQWAGEARAAHMLATSLCKTAFVPAHFRGKPEEAAAAILTGHELGLSPMASLRAIYVISGTPGMYAKAMAAVVQAAGHEVWVESQSDDEVIVCGRRKGSEHEHRVVWNRERVVKAKLTSNAKYQDTPQQMMVARGTGEICRQIAPDALHGIPYTVEELRTMPPADVAAQGESSRVTVAEILAAVDHEPPADAVAEFVDAVVES